MADRQETDRRAAGGDGAPVAGSAGTAPSASEIVGEEQAELDGRFGAHVEGPGTLGGTGTHHRASYSDPLPAVGMRQAEADDTDGATGHRTPGAGSPEWMRDGERS